MVQFNDFNDKSKFSTNSYEIFVDGMSHKQTNRSILVLIQIMVQVLVFFMELLLPGIWPVLRIFAGLMAMLVEPNFVPGLLLSMSLVNNIWCGIVAAYRLKKKSDISETMNLLRAHIDQRLNELLPPEVIKKLTVTSDDCSCETEFVLRALSLSQ